MILETVPQIRSSGLYLFINSNEWRVIMIMFPTTRFFFTTGSLLFAQNLSRLVLQCLSGNFPICLPSRFISFQSAWNYIERNCTTVWFVPCRSIPLLITTTLRPLNGSALKAENNRTVKSWPWKTQVTMNVSKSSCATGDALHSRMRNSSLLIYFQQKCSKFSSQLKYSLIFSIIYHLLRPFNITTISVQYTDSSPTYQTVTIFALKHFCPSLRSALTSNCLK